MDINQFNIYSMLSATEHTDKNITELILAELEKFKSYNSVSDLKQYLESRYSFDPTKRQFYIYNQILAKVFDSEETFSLEISLGNKEFIYSYLKGDIND